MAGRLSGRRGLIAVAGLALLARFVLIALTRDEFTPLLDAADYDRHAQSIAAGDGYPDAQLTAGGGPSAFRAPVYPYLLGGLYSITGTSWTAARLLGALLGVLAVVLLYLIVVRVWGERAALWSGGLAALFPPLVVLSGSLLSESPFIAIELGLVLTLLVWRSAPRSRWALLAGALCGLAALTRSNGILLLIPALAAVATVRPLVSRAGLRAPALVLAAALVTVSPWLARNAVTFDRPVGITTQAGVGLAGTYNDAARTDPRHPAAWRSPNHVAEYEALFSDPRLDEAELDSKLRRQASTYALDHPGYIVEAAWQNTLRMFDLTGGGGFGVKALLEQGIGTRSADLATLSFYIVGVLGLLGAAALLARRAPRGPAFLWLIPLLMIAGAVAISGTARYRAPVDPFVVILATLGALALADRLRGGTA